MPQPQTRCHQRVPGCLIAGRPPLLGLGDFSGNEGLRLDEAKLLLASGAPIKEDSSRALFVLPVMSVIFIVSSMT